MSSKDSQATPTIVGGQPAGRQGGDTGLPHGIEAIVLLAAADDHFRRDFAKDRVNTLARAGITLNEVESSILSTVSDSELFAMAKRTGAVPRSGKRGLMATAVSLAALASMTTGTLQAKGGKPELPARPALSQLDSQSPSPQSDDPVRSILIDTPTPTPTPTPIVVDGIRPDTPTPTATVPISNGIRPDTPTPTPTPTSASFGIQPDTPTATTTPAPAGILPDTPTATATPTPAGILPDTPTPTSTPNADLNNDGSVNHTDLMLFLQQWYETRGGEEKKK
jgi:hypothetical protein